MALWARGRVYTCISQHAEKLSGGGGGGAKKKMLFRGFWSCCLQKVQDILRTVPTNSKVFLPGFLNMREKQI